MNSLQTSIFGTGDHTLHYLHDQNFRTTQLVVVRCAHCSWCELSYKAMIRLVSRSPDCMFNHTVSLLSCQSGF